jgi:hypothetical protein
VSAQCVGDRVGQRRGRPSDQATQVPCAGEQLAATQAEVSACSVLVYATSGTPAASAASMARRWLATRSSTGIEAVLAAREEYDAHAERAG